MVKDLREIELGILGSLQNGCNRLTFLLGLFNLQLENHHLRSTNWEEKNAYSLKSAWDETETIAGKCDPRDGAI